MNYNEYLNTLSNFGVVNELQQQATQALTEKKDTDLTDLAFSSGGVGKFAERVKGYYDKGMELKAKGEEAYKAYQEKGIEGVAEKIQPKLGELVGKGKKLVRTVEDGGVEKGIGKIKEFAGSKLAEAKSKLDEAKNIAMAETENAKLKLKEIGNIPENLKERGVGKIQKLIEEPRNVLSRDIKRTTESVRQQMEDFDPEEGINMISGISREAVSSVEAPSLTESFPQIMEMKDLTPVAEGIEKAPEVATTAVEELQRVPETLTEVGKGMIQPVEDVLQGVKSSAEQGMASAKNVVESSTSKLMSAGEDLAKGGTEFAEKTASEALGAVSEIPIIGELADVALAGYSLYDLLKSRPSVPSTLTSIGASYAAGQI
jgi:hypothetical protein